MQLQVAQLQQKTFFIANLKLAAYEKNEQSHYLQPIFALNHKFILA
jgi:hypothetical protein